MPNPRDQLRAQAARQLGADQAAAGQLDNISVTQGGTVEHIRGEMVLPSHQEQQARHQAVFGQVGEGVFDLGGASDGLLVGPTDNVVSVGPTMLGGVETGGQNQGPAPLPAERPDLMSAAQDQGALAQQHAAHVGLYNSDQNMFG